MGGVQQSLGKNANLHGLMPPPKLLHPVELMFIFEGRGSRGMQCEQTHLDVVSC